MSKLRVASFTISIDGFGAGPDQSLQQPLGVGGEELHKWLVGTHMFQKMSGNSGGSTGTDNALAVQGFERIGAWILGRNMFGPVRGPWPNDEWKGWWGKNPPYHCDVFVLTHYPRKSITMEGGTTFHFVTDGIHAALERAVDAANGLDIRLGGGVSTIQQYVNAGLVNELHIAISPVLLGKGEHLFSGIDFLSLGYRVVEHVTSESAMHVVLSKD